jgi:hypothetical protein
MLSQSIETEPIKKALSLIDDWIIEHVPAQAKIDRSLSVKPEGFTLTIQVRDLILTQEQLGWLYGSMPKKWLYEPLIQAMGWLSAEGGRLDTVSTKENGTIFSIFVESDNFRAQQILQIREFTDRLGLTSPEPLPLIPYPIKKIAKKLAKLLDFKARNRHNS